ncbi:MAG TPA: hydrogenase formation protein HypD, partial [Phycisphaerae bacterium]|nr:hydrogenase formation protein HypD [Phycisphaerae bacterium]
GDVIRGAIEPHDCPLFGRTCTPAKPVGPCMVSREGSCQAEYRYGTGA